MFHLNLIAYGIKNLLTVMPAIAGGAIAGRHSINTTNLFNLLISNHNKV